MERTYFFYFLVLCVGTLSVYNFFDNLESNAHLEEFKRKSSAVGDFIQQHRQRRNAKDDEADDPWKIVFDLKIEKLTRFVRATANETFQEEFKKVLAELKKDIPTKCSCDNTPNNCQTESRRQRGTIKKDGLQIDYIAGTHGNRNDRKTITCLQGPRGPPGPPGPPGPIGPPGKRGLGLQKPKMVNSTLNIVVNETDDVTFECVFFGSPIPSVEWESDSFNVSKIIHSIDKEKSQITSRLSVSNVNWSNKGPVKCEARSILGEAYANGSFVIHAAPIINLQKRRIFVPRGINYQFPECKVRAFPKAKITWKRLFWSLPEGRHSTNDGFLNISRVKYDDEGFYICEAENFLGKAVEKVQLKTNRFEMHEKPLPNLHGRTYFIITCSAYGNPDEMSGQITRVDGAKETPMETVINKTENLFSIKAVVKKGGTYSCSIKFKEEETKSFTNVKLTLSSESCKKIKEYNPSAVSGSYLINLSKPTRVYCDMETDGGGWIRIGKVQTTTSTDVNNYNINNILSTNLLDLNKAASQNFLLSGATYRNLQSYVKFHEFRVFCTKPYHGRKHHASFSDQTTSESKKVFDYLMDKYSKYRNTCNALKYMPDDNSVTRSSDCTTSILSVQSSVNARFYKFIWYINGKTHINLGSNSRMECDDYYSRSSGYNNFGTWLFYVR